MHLRVWQVMRMATPSSPVVKERKVSQSASSKIDSIIRQLFLPMLGMPTPERTSFLPEDAEDQILRQVAQERPAALLSESDFVDYMVVLYRKFQKDQCAVGSGLGTGLGTGLGSGLGTGLGSSSVETESTETVVSSIDSAKECELIVKNG